MDESNMPLASVIIPTYNGEAFIREAVGSALAQTYPNIEIMVVDDGSTDGTRKQLEDFIKDGRIKYVFQQNAGPGVARNTGIRNTSGELIALLDHDDLWMPEKIEKQVRYMLENPRVDIVFCNGCCFDDKRKDELRPVHDVSEKFEGLDFFEMFDKGLQTLPTAVVFKRRAIELTGDFINGIDGGEDWDMWFRMAAKGLKFAYVVDMLFKRRLHSANMTNSLTATKAEYYRLSYGIFEPLIKNLSKKDSTHVKKRLALNIFISARKAMGGGNFKDGVHYGLKAAGFQYKYYFKLPGLIVRYLRFMLRRKFGINQ